MIEGTECSDECNLLCENSSLFRGKPHRVLEAVSKERGRKNHERETKHVFKLADKALMHLKYTVLVLSSLQPVLRGATKMTIVMEQFLYDEKLNRTAIFHGDKG